MDILDEGLVLLVLSFELFALFTRSYLAEELVDLVFEVGRREFALAALLFQFGHLLFQLGYTVAPGRSARWR